MKRIGFILLLSSFLLTSFAQHQFGSLFIATSNNQRFWLFIDDILQNEYSVPSIKVQGMQYQQYKIRIEMDNVNANCVGQLITISRQPNGDSYVVSSRSNDYFITKTQSNMRPALTQNLIQPNYNYYNDYHQYLYPGFGNPGNYWQGSGNNQGKAYQYNQSLNTRGGQHGGHNPPNQGKPGGNLGNQNTPCRNPAEFNSAMVSIKKETFESGKLQFAKNMTASGSICVEQIIEICNAFSFDATKLEYAKFAYVYCGDKNLYYMVNNVFQFQSSKDELTKFIR